MYTIIQIQGWITFTKPYPLPPTHRFTTIAFILASTPVQLCHVSTTQMLVVCAPLKHKSFHYLTSSTSLCVADGKYPMLRSLICCSFTRNHPVPDTMCVSLCFNQVSGTTPFHEILPCCPVGNEIFNTYPLP